MDVNQYISSYDTQQRHQHYILEVKWCSTKLNYTHHGNLFMQTINELHLILTILPISPVAPWSPSPPTIPYFQLFNNKIIIRCMHS